MSQPIATLELLGQLGTAPAFPVRVAVGAPILDELPSTFACNVEVQPLHTKPFTIYGEGSLQALSLASKHAIQMLATFIEQGGSLTYPDGDAFDPRAYGFRLLGEE